MNSKLTYFFLSLAAILLSSCTSDAPDDRDFGNGAEMSFDVSGTTRATVTSSFNKFVVYGDMKFWVENGNNIVNPIELFHKTEVEYKDNSWSYSGTKYWMPRHEHSFIAVAPISVVEAGTTPEYLNSKLSFTYTIPTTGGKMSDRSDVADIIIATHRRLYDEKDTNTTTTFKFGHVMSLINIAPEFNDSEMKDDDFMKIHKLEISGFITKGVFNVQPASRESNSQTDDSIIEVTGHEGEGVYTIEFNEPKIITNHGGKVLFFDPEDAIILLPQTFPADSQAKIVLTYTINNGTQESQIIVPLKRLRLDAGKSYTYRLLFDKYGLKMEAMSISDWEVEESPFDATIE